MDLVLHTFDLPLARPFRIARETICVQPTLIVELQADGFSGWGEATENAYYDARLSTMIVRLKQLRGHLQSADPLAPDRLWQELDSRLCEDRFAQSALDQAAWDLAGKLQQQPVWKLWGLDPHAQELVPSSYTLAIDSPEVLLEKLAEQPGFPCYKLKLGGQQDAESLAAVRGATEARLRVDVNGGWDLATATAWMPKLEACGVELVEQPLAADQLSSVQQLQSQTRLPLIADEDCVVETDVERVSQAYRGINVKLVKCGGLTPALRMLRTARQLGLRTMVGCMTESSVGISAAAQLLPLLDYADLDGALLLAQDVATGVVVQTDGRVKLNETPGTGVRLL
jgi:L-alanine-DL-glutamate epimerase-like enolase superfamily enzyme